MISAFNPKKTRIAPTDMLDKFRPFMARVTAVFRATRNSVVKVNVAQAARCNLASFTTQDFQDTGIDPSDATGIASLQVELPFFMQSGFGRK